MIDKYDAFRVRSGKTRAEAIGILRSMVERSKKNGGLSRLLAPEGAERVAAAYNEAIDLMDEVIAE